MDITQAIYISTAQQVGLANNENVPDLVQFLLSRQSYSYSSRFLRKWITNPPPRYVGTKCVSCIVYIVL